MVDDVTLKVRMFALKMAVKRKNHSSSLRTETTDLAKKFEQYLLGNDTP